MILLVFFAGLCVGAVLSVIACSLCLAARRGDQLRVWRELPEDEPLTRRKA